MNAKKKIEKTAFVDTEIRGIQTPRRNECASLSQNKLWPARAGLWGGPAVQFPGVPTHEGRYDVNGMISNMVLVNSGFHTQENVSEIIRNLCTRPQTAAQPCPRLNKFKNFGFGGAKLLALPGRPRLGPALTPAPLFNDIFPLASSAAYLAGILDSNSTSSTLTSG
jgi:hypothetical protein